MFFKGKLSEGKDEFFRMMDEVNRLYGERVELAGEDILISDEAKLKRCMEIDALINELIPKIDAHVKEQAGVLRKRRTILAVLMLVWMVLLGIMSVNFFIKRKFVYSFIDLINLVFAFKMFLRRVL